MARTARAKLCQNFRNVLALRGEVSGAVCISGIVAQQVTVFLHIRAAARSIRDNRFDIGLLERVDRFFGKLDSGSFFARMHQQCTAAPLRAWSNNFTTLCGEHTNSCCIDVRKEFALHATKQEPYAPALRTNRGS